MRFRFPLLLVVALSLLSALSGAPLERPQFTHRESDLPVDERVRFGELPSGLRYAILANAEPKERSSLRLVVMAGSLHEQDDQRGLAHFLEHMAFNGSTHYPPGTLIEFFQRMGMSFGGDTNAYTSFDHTVYMLELPDSKAPTLDEGLRVFADYAGGLLLGEEELNRERGIILSERRARDSVQFRQMVAEFDFLLGSTRVAHRLPIGKEEVIAQAPRERFTHYYDAFYRPERLAVVAVGDFDAAAVETRLREALAGLAARGPAPAALEMGEITRFSGLRARHHHDAEAGATTVGIQTVAPYSPEPDSRALRLKRLPRDLATSMLTRRLAILAKREDAPFIGGSATASVGLNFFLNASIELACRPEQWPAALTVAENELRRALEHGFGADELREATATYLNSLKQAVQTASTRRSEGLARELVQCLVNGEVFTTPATDLALYEPALAAVTPEACRDALREAFSSPGRYLTVMGNATLADNTPAEAQILAAYETAARNPVSAREQQEEAAFAYTDFGSPGQVERQSHVADLDLHQVRFSNGVRLNLKKTDFEAGRIHLVLRTGSGQLVEPRDKPGLALFSSLTFTAGGLGKHSADDLQRILAGRTVGLGFRVAADALVFNAATNREDLLLQLQLLAAFLTDPGYREEAQRSARKRIEPIYRQLNHTPSGPLQLEVPRILSSGDPRFGLPPLETMLARTLEEARAWLQPQLASGAIELSLVGDLEPAEVVTAVASTLGSLPPRREKPPLEAERQVTIPAEPVARTFQVVTAIPKGLLAVYWPTDDAREIQRTRRLNLLASVMTDRLRVRVREELGESYSPDAGSAPDSTYRDYGFLYSQVTIDPGKAAVVEKAVLEIADALVRDGITEDEFTRAKQPVLTSIRESVRTNGYWLNSVLAASQEYPEHLDWSRSRNRDIEGMTREEVEAFARKYLPSRRAFRFVVIPAAK